MRIVFDTNVLIDAIAQRDNYEVAQKLLLRATDKDVRGIITANSVTDIYYILRKRIGDTKSRIAIWKLMSGLEVVPVDRESCEIALVLPMKDFEDAVLAACAAKANADYIVSRDAGFQAADGSPVRVVNPEKMLELMD